MNISAATIELLLPAAARWVSEQESLILREGVPLNAAELVAARAIGVQSPENVRLLLVPQIPLPSEPQLLHAAVVLGLASPVALGMAMGQGIYIRSDIDRDLSVVIHELVHVRQCQQLGGSAAFLREYILECFVHGYDSAPLEREAVAVATQLAG